MKDASENKFRFDVFISYARGDSAQVEHLVARLRGDGFHVWYDRDEMSGGQTTIGQLADGIACSAHMIACLSDSYVDRDYTDFELQTNQSFDPANRQNRTIPVLVRPLTKPVPVQIRAFTYGDLTNEENYEREYRMITGLMRKGIATADPEGEPELDAETARGLCAAAVEAQAEPQIALFKTRLAAETLSRFLYWREIGKPPANATLDALVGQLIAAHKLPAHIGMSLGTVRTYGNFVVLDGADIQAISTESIRPGLAALRVLTNWLIATHLHKTEDRDEWDALCSQLPPGDNPGERLVPGTRFVLCAPRLAVNRHGAVYSGRDAETGQSVMLLLAKAPKDASDSFLEAVARLIRLNEGGIVRPLRCGRIHPGGKWIGDYAAFEGVEGVLVSELQQRFTQLPTLATFEICRGIAEALEVLHNATPPINHGDIGPATTLITKYGAVKLVSMISTSVSDVAQDDLKALCTTLASLLPPTESWSDLVAGLSKALSECSSAAEAHSLLSSACRQSLSGTGLRTVIDCYRENKALSGSESLKSVSEPGPRRTTEFDLVCELAVPAAGAWPAGSGRMLVWEQESRELLIASHGTVVWRDDRPMRLRFVVQAVGGRCAAAGWDGRVLCFSAESAPARARLAGALGDMRFISGNWVAGTWQQTLALITEDGTVQPIPPAIDAGVYRIAANEKGDLFAIADLAGTIWLYSAGNRVVGVPPLARVRDLAYCGRRLVVLAGDSLIWVGQDGAVGTPEPLPPGHNRLLAYRAEDGCLLLAEDGSSWALSRSGARLPHYRFPSGTDLGVCGVPKRFVARSEQGWAYWRDGATQVATWSDALSAQLSWDGSQIAIRAPGMVQLYRDPL